MVHRIRHKSHVCRKGQNTLATRGRTWSSLTCNAAFGPTPAPLEAASKHWFINEQTLIYQCQRRGRQSTIKRRWQPSTINQWGAHLSSLQTMFAIVAKYVCLFQEYHSVKLMHDEHHVCARVCLCVCVYVNACMHASVRVCIYVYICYIILFTQWHDAYVHYKQ